MNLFEKLLYFFQEKMVEPSPFGWFHILWIFLTISVLFILYCKRKNYSEKQLKLVLATYGIITFILELLKQLTWSFNYDSNTTLIIWDYQWYAAPFQLCTTPLYVSIICLFMKKNKIRDSLLSYIAFYTILGSIATILMPESCFTEYILINIHTMYLHCGSLVLSIYLLFTKEVKINIKSLVSGLYVFLIFVSLALIINVFIFNTILPTDETFKMFYISPYFISELPIFNTIQENMPYLVFLIIYVIAFYLGAS